MTIRRVLMSQAGKAEAVKRVNRALFKEMPGILVSWMGRIYGEGGWPVARVAEKRWQWETEQMRFEARIHDDRRMLVSAWMRQDGAAYTEQSRCMAWVAALDDGG